MTHADVEVRLFAAFDALKRCAFRTGDRPGAVRAAWPDALNELAFIDQLGLKTTVRPAPPQKDEYDRMVDALGWLLWIEDRATRWMISARCVGASWPRIRQRDGRDEKTLRKHYRLGLVTIAARLNLKG